MFYVVSLLTLKTNNSHEVLGVRLYDSDNSILMDLDIDAFRRIAKPSELANKPEYMDLLQTRGNQLVTQLEIANPSLQIVDCSLSSGVVEKIQKDGYRFWIYVRQLYLSTSGSTVRMYHMLTNTETPNITYDVNKDGVISFLAPFGTFNEVIGSISNGRARLKSTKEPYDFEWFEDLALFQRSLNAQYGTSFNVKEVVKQMEQELKFKGQLENDKKTTLSVALMRGNKLSMDFLNALPWEGIKGVGGYAIEGKSGYIYNQPYKKFYHFLLDSEFELYLFEKLKDGVTDQTWCHCGYSGTDVKYVENHRGVSHGYICPKCKRFKQIG